MLRDKAECGIPLQSFDEEQEVSLLHFQQKPISV